MLFQKFTALVVLVVFISQGAMAAPRPSPPPPISAPSRPQSIVDDLYGTGGKALGTTAIAILPSDMIKQGIEGGGGIVAPKVSGYPSAAPGGPQDVIDNLVDNSGRVIGTEGAGIIPGGFVKPAINAAGGMVVREEAAFTHLYTLPHPATAGPPQRVADDLDNTGKVLGKAGAASNVVDQAIKVAGV